MASRERSLLAPVVVATAACVVYAWLVHRRRRLGAQSRAAAHQSRPRGRQDRPTVAPKAPRRAAERTAAVPLVHRGADFVAVDKPSGMIVHHWSSGAVEDVPPLVEVLRGWPEFAAGKVHLVHRLDRQTSGVLLVGRTPEAAAELAAALEAGSKVYATLCRGTTPEAFRVDRPLRVREPKASLGRKSGRKAKQAAAQLREECVMQSAVTDFVRVATCCDGRCSLLLALPRTGRYHQIRRHLDGARHSVSGDADYGPSGINALLREAHGLTRPFLHAACVLLTHRGEALRLAAPLPDSLRSPLLSMAGGREAALALDAALGALDEAWVAEARRRAAAGPRITTSYRAAIAYDPSQHARAGGAEEIGRERTEGNAESSARYTISERR